MMNASLMCMEITTGSLLRSIVFVDRLHGYIAGDALEGGARVPSSPSREAVSTVIWTAAGYQIDTARRSRSGMG